MSTATPEFDRNNFAILLDSPRLTAGGPERLEISKRTVSSRTFFDFTVYSGMEDLTFHGLSPEQLRSIGESLIRLSGA